MNGININGVGRAGIKYPRDVKLQVNHLIKTHKQNGLSGDQIADHLNESGIRTPSGGLITKRFVYNQIVNRNKKSKRGVVTPYDRSVIYKDLNGRARMDVDFDNLASIIQQIYTGKMTSFANIPIATQKLETTQPKAPKPEPVYSSRTYEFKNKQVFGVFKDNQTRPEFACGLYKAGLIMKFIKELTQYVNNKGKKQ